MRLHPLAITSALLGAGLLLSIVGYLSFRPSFQGLHLEPVALPAEAAADTLVMENAKLRGFDSKGRPFEFTAGLATHKTANLGKKLPNIDLKDLTANVVLNDATTASAKATTGYYDSNLQMLFFTNGVNIIDTQQRQLALQNLTVDLNKQRASTESPVTVTSKQGNLSAPGLIITNSDEGQRLLFKGPAQATLRP